MKWRALVSIWLTIMKLTLPILFHLFVTVQAQRNIARDGAAFQSSTAVFNGFPYWASLAIDAGKPNDFQSKSCSLTDTGYYAAWWMLHFDVEVFVTEVNIIYRIETIYRFSHYGLYVSNDTVPSNGKPNGHLCYQHPGQPDPSPIENVTCNAFGKNVIVYNYRNRSQSYPGIRNDHAHVELCDVEVYGCSKGTYGSGCMKTCPNNCLDRHCFPQNGTCIWGCNGENCLNSKCNATSCVDGCKPGYKGTTCDEVCTSPNYGSNCKHHCHCFNNQECDINNGLCPIGCAKGWQGSNCSTECSRGQYGYNCNETCYGCVSDLCERSNGECDIKGQCKWGWMGPKCNKPCDSGKFGLNCSDVCHCSSQPCSQETGDCPPGGCQPGYHGKTCSTECIIGSYGHNCAKSCNTCYNSLCERYAGNCTSGCIDGYWGRKCQVSYISEAKDSDYAGVVGGLCSTAVVFAIVVAVIVLLSF